MSDEQQIITIPDTRVVAVPQPDIDVLIEERVTPIVIESSDVDVVVLDKDINIVDTVHEISIVTVGEVGPIGPQGLPGSAQSTITRITAIPIGGHRVVVLDGSEHVIYADYLDLTHADKVLGVTTGAADAGALATIQTYGEMVEPSFSLTPGDAVYVGANGMFTQTSPASGFSRGIGFAMAPTKLFIDLSVPTVRA
jgi:hypothetical protein